MYTIISAVSISGALLAVQEKTALADTTEEVSVYSKSSTEDGSNSNAVTESTSSNTDNKGISGPLIQNGSGSSAVGNDSNSTGYSTAAGDGGTSTGNFNAVTGGSTEGDSQGDTTALDANNSDQTDPKDTTSVHTLPTNSDGTITNTQAPDATHYSTIEEEMLNDEVVFIVKTFNNGDIYSAEIHTGLGKNFYQTEDQYINQSQMPALALVRAPGTDAGTYQIYMNSEFITAFNEHAQNLSIDPSKVQLGTFTIAKQPVTITANPNSKFEGEKDPEFTAKVDYSTDKTHEAALNYTLKREPAETPGTYKISIVLGDNPNYSIKTVDGIFTIKPNNLTFNGNGITKDQDAAVGSFITLPKSGFSRPGYRLIGWNTNPDGSGVEYKVGSDYTVSANTQLYAQWTTNRSSGSSTKDSNKDNSKINYKNQTISTYADKPTVDLYKLSNDNIMSVITNRVLAPGTDWFNDATMMIDDVGYYRVATNEWAKMSQAYPYEDLNLYIRTYNDSEKELYKAEDELIANRILAPSSSWITDRKTYVINNSKYYRVATNEFVSANDVYVYSPVSLIVTVNSNTYANIYNAKGQLVNNRALRNDTSWKTDSITYINGDKYYRVATDEFVKSSDVDVNH